MRRTLAALPLILGLLAAACGDGTGTPPTTPPSAPTAPPATETTEPSSPAPTTAASPTSPQTSSPASPDASDPDGTDSVTAYLVRDASGQFWVEPVTVELDEPTTGVARAAVQAALRGEAADPALTSAANPATEVLGASIADGVLTIDVSDDIRSPAGGSSAELALAQQLAHSGAQFDGVDAVLLHVEGEPVDELWGHLDWSEPVEPDPFAVSPIVISAPTWGQLVRSGDISVRGTANTFEATVELRLIDPSGTAVEETFTTATCGTGCRGTWTQAFTVDSPGRWAVEAVEPDPSGGEGRAPFTTRVEFEVA